MKKILFLILMVMFVLTMTISSYGVQQFNSDQRIQTEVVTDQYALSTTITTNNRLLGYRFSDTNYGTIKIYDSAAVSDTQAGYLRIVDRSGVNTSSVGQSFDYPMEIKRGIVTRMGTTTGTVVLYYE